MQVIGTNEIRGLDVCRSIGEHSLRLGAVCSVKSVIITLFITSGNKNNNNNNNNNNNSYNNNNKNNFLLLILIISFLCFSFLFVSGY